MRRFSLLIALSLPLSACTPSGSGQPCASVSSDIGADSDPGAAVAEVNGTTITMAQVDEEASAAISKARSDLYRARKQAIDRMIDDQLLEAEAKKQGKTKDELIKAEVDEKVGEPSDDEAKAFFEKNPRVAGRDFAELAPRIKSFLQRQNVQKRREEFIAGLRQNAGVKIMLEPIRVTVNVADAPTKGGKDALVTVVEFSDFQCPYCSKGKTIIDDLSKKYGDSVQIAFMHFPLPMHPEAPKAAEASECARDQGKFWEMHDLLFENQRNGLKVENLKQYAGQLGLDQGKFDTCLDDGTKTALVDAAHKEGQKAGVSGTPGFFVNGRFINGAVPLEQFEQIIDEELQKKGVDPASVKKG